MHLPGTVRVTDIGIECILIEPQLSDHKLQDIGVHLDQLADRAGRNTFLLDFHHVRYLTSSALGKVVSLHKRMKDAGGALRVINVSPELFEMFHATRLSTFIDVHAKPVTEHRLGALSAHPGPN
jgi:anti-sigma B factor antagonist